MPKLDASDVEYKNKFSMDENTLIVGAFDLSRRWAGKMIIFVVLNYKQMHNIKQQCEAVACGHRYHVLQRSLLLLQH